MLFMDSIIPVRLNSHKNKFVIYMVRLIIVILKKDGLEAKIIGGVINVR